MSRVGLKPIPVPTGVEAHIGNGVVQVKGPKGSILVHLMPGISAELKDGAIALSRADEERQSRAFHGLNRALIANAATGVSDGWKKQLDIVGIGYKAEKQAEAVVFNLGYSHPINFPVPGGDRDRGGRQSQSYYRDRASTVSRSGKSRRKSAPFVRQSPTRARASAIPERTCGPRPGSRERRHESGQRS